MPLEDVDFTDLYTFTRSSDAQFIGSAGLLETASTDVAALAWSASGVSQGLVLEGSAVQSMANTSDPDAVFAATNGTIAADQVDAPDGATTAASFLETTANGSHHIGKNAGISGNAGTLTNFSLFVKPVGRTKIQVSLFDFGALSNYIRSTFDLSAGTVTSAVGGNGSLVLAPPPEAYPDGWYRLTLIGIPNVGGSGVTYPRVAALNDAGAGNYVGDVAKGFYFWGCNATVATEQRSFIATTTAPKTRGADLCSLNSLDTTFGATQGTIYCKFIVPAAAPATANRTILHADDGTTDNSYDLRIDAGTLNVSLVVRSGGSEVANITAGAASAGSVNTVAFSYIADAFRISLNGATAVSDTSGAVPTGISALYLGAADNAGTAALNGIMKQLRRRRAALNAVDLKAETST